MPRVEYASSVSRESAWAATAAIAGHNKNNTGGLVGLQASLQALSVRHSDITIPTGLTHLATLLPGTEHVPTAPILPPIHT